MWKNRLYRLIGMTGVVSLSLTLLGGCGQEENVYRETVAELGALSVGVEESGSVDIGTVEQIFELDMNALQRVELSDNTSFGGSAGGSFGGSSMGGMSSGGGAMPGMSAGGAMGGNAGMGGGSSSGAGSAGSGNGGAANMFGQIFDMAGGDSVVSAGESSELTVAEVTVTVGERIKEGDVLYLLDEEGVAELTEELQSNVEKAKADLDAVIADQKLTKTTAQYTYELSVAYGKYAQLEKDSSVDTLNASVAEAEAALADAKVSLEEYKAQLKQITLEYEKALQAYENAVWSRDNVNKKESLYLYTVYAENAIAAKSLAESMEQQKEQAEQQVEQAESNAAQYEKSLASAKRSLESETLTAKETYELRKLAYDTAQETYDIAVAYLEDDLKAQENIYEEAKEKWEEFNSHIDGNAVKSKYNGIVTEVNLTEGDGLTTGAAVISLYDTDEVSMTVTIDEENMTDIKVGGSADIRLTAYPEEIFHAQISEISDASTDSDGNTTYDVTAVITENGDMLFQGMTGKIIFITRESEEVIYVSNRAIIREDKTSYVKVKDEKGNISKVKVVTGFSDGENVEILEGLNVGDVVLIESKVSAE